MTIAAGVLSREHSGRGDGLPVLQVEHVTKSFGDVLANSDVSFAVPAGSVVALLGENGAGKSTAMNAVCGLYLPETGRILVDGRPVELGSPSAAVAAGVGMVHQQFKLVDTLTGYENISLATDRGRFLQRRQAPSALTDLMQEVGFQLDLAAPVWTMPLAARQQLEILRVLAQGARLLILDEPTSVLSPKETEQLFGIVKRIAASGRSIILISHKLAEIEEIADHLVVMRGGRVVFEGPNQSLTGDDIAELIIGKRVVRAGQRPQTARGERQLSVRNVSIAGRDGATVVSDVSFDVHGGELVAVLGVTGNGQSELFDAIGGLLRHSSGQIDAPRRAGRRAFAFIPSRHLGIALAPGLSLEDNALLGSQHNPPFGPWLAPARVRLHARAVLGSFGVKADPGSATRRLSGGNLQRVVLGRELASQPSLIVASYPTRGLDIASAAQIRAALAERAVAGNAVLMASEELDESLEIATRVLVMSSGRIVADLAPQQFDRVAIGRLMTAARTH
ncbi:Autoinducer 2 import ATP-binding protein LsrA [Hyphomicrobiales bacterium]|nr:Autoinducer 2 import ATP-binding protein LsrA [Hyphomicrobiales bacterium]CAH1693031.1 Autoinducer 2 import ATP-binding protein LsrA [Hyphomicrobiales bacterium]